MAVMYSDRRGKDEGSGSKEQAGSRVQDREERGIAPIECEGGWASLAVRIVQGVAEDSKCEAERAQVWMMKKA